MNKNLILIFYFEKYIFLNKNKKITIKIFKNPVIKNNPGFKKITKKINK